MLDEAGWALTKTRGGCNTACHYSLSGDGERPRNFPWRLTTSQQAEELSPDARGHPVVLRTLGRKDARQQE